MKNFIICLLFMSNLCTYAQMKNDFIEINSTNSNKSTISYLLKNSNSIVSNDMLANSDNFSYNRQIPVEYKGVLRFVDIDRSGTYKNLNNTYILSVDEKGYTFKTDKGKFIANIRQNDNDNYLFVNKKEIAHVWFKENGDMIVETYELKDDVFIKNLYIKI